MKLYYKRGPNLSKPNVLFEQNCRFYPQVKPSHTIEELTENNKDRDHSKQRKSSQTFT